MTRSDVPILNMFKCKCDSLGQRTTFLVNRLRPPIKQSTLGFSHADVSWGVFCSAVDGKLSAKK